MDEELQERENSKHKMKKKVVIVWFWISCSWNSSFIIQKGGKFKINIRLQYPIIQYSSLHMCFGKHEAGCLYIRTTIVFPSLSF